jgi:hypothetical protein
MVCESQLSEGNLVAAISKYLTLAISIPEPIDYPIRVGRICAH